MDSPLLTQSDSERPRARDDIERVHAAAAADRRREAEARARLVGELDRMRSAAEQAGQAFTKAVATVQRFLDVYTDLVGDDPEGVVSSVWFDPADNAVYVTVGDLR